MKKVYMPTEEELYIMQDKGMNMYKYLLVKAIESIIMDIKINGNYRSYSKSIIENIHNRYLRENPYIEQAICRLYPEELANAKIANSDISLCRYLISSDYNPNNPIYNLDNLVYFKNGVGVLTHKTIVKSTIKTLDDELPKAPKYRFEYKPNKLLDSIFNCEINPNQYYLQREDLAKIEPAYVLKQCDDSGISNPNNFVNKYGERYGIQLYEYSEYENQDILTNPDSDVKRLIRCIKTRTK